MKNIILAIILILISFELNAGGIVINPESVRINGQYCGAEFSRYERNLNMSFRASSYSFSGGNYEFEYIIFRLRNIENRKSVYLIHLNRVYEDFGECDYQFPLRFPVPEIYGEFEISYSREPIYSNALLPMRTNIYAKYPQYIYRSHYHSFDRDYYYEYDYYYGDGLYSFFRDRNRLDFTDLCSFSINRNAEYPTSIPKTYLKVNGKVPSLNTQITGGASDNPLKFSWESRNVSKVRDLEYRYRLYPYNEEWSKWSNETYTWFHTLPKGINTFELECRYVLRDRSRREKTHKVKADIKISKPFFSRRVSYNAINSTRKYDNIESYSNSKALLIGITDFKHFPILPQLNNDILHMETALYNQGFSINKISGEISGIEIINAVQSFAASLDSNSRGIIYFSSHGFKSGNKGFLATTECNPSSIDSNCINFEVVKNILIKIDTKHLLIIFDTCFSGMGATTKDVISKELLNRQGFHVITAGMEDQKAQIKKIHDKPVSVFTYFLGHGITDYAADYTKDGIITLSELFLYTQSSVAKETDGSQIPMLSKLRGNGEMYFSLDKQ